MATCSVLRDTKGMRNTLNPLNTKSVFVVEDAPPIRERLTAMLRESNGVEVIGEADNPQSAIQGILSKKPDSVVRLGGTGGRASDSSSNRFHCSDQFPQQAIQAEVPCIRSKLLPG